MEVAKHQTARRRRFLWIAGPALLAAATLAAAIGRGAMHKPPEVGQQPVYEVSEGPLTISVTETGTIQARDQVVIRSEVEGSTTILTLVPEGTFVKKGDLLVELDASKLQDSKVDQEIRVQNAEAAFVSATENLAVVKNQAQSDVDQAELALQFAREDLKKYQEGDYPNQLKELESRITLAEQTRQQAEDKLHWSQILFDEKYLAETELKSDQLAVRKAQLDVELARSNLALLKDYTNKRTLEKLQSDVKQAEMALDRAKRKAKADIVQAESTLKARELEFTREKDKLQKIEQQIAKAKIFAPTSGQVVYATSAEVSRPGRNVQPLAEGQQVRERQELIYLPTGSTFMMQVSIHESSLEKVRIGLPAKVTVDALAGKSFAGRVSSIAPLPDAESMFMNPDLKVYKTQIQITGTADLLRSGMTCRAEIVVEQYESAIYVPIQCVVRVNGQTTAFVQKPGGIEARPVEIGLDNNRMVRIVSGLRVGEKVLLNPPLDTSGGGRNGQTTGARSGSQADTVRPRTSGAPPGPPLVPEGTAPAPPVAGAEASQPGPARPRGNWGNLSADEKQKMRERFEKMSPEEREAIRQRMRQQFGGSGLPDQGAPEESQR